MTKRKPAKAKEAGAQAEALEPEDLFEMANLFPRTTGLPMTVWVSPPGNARHDVRVKVNMTHGNQMSVTNTAVVAIRPSPHLIAGSLSPDDQRAVRRRPYGDDGGVGHAHLLLGRPDRHDPTRAAAEAFTDLVLSAISCSSFWGGVHRLPD